jgi:hypothetical protein
MYPHNTHTHTHTHTRIPTYTHECTRTHTFLHVRIHSLSLSLSLTLSLPHTHTHTHTLSLSLQTWIGALLMRDTLDIVVRTAIEQQIGHVRTKVIGDGREAFERRVIHLTVVEANPL